MIYNRCSKDRDTFSGYIIDVVNIETYINPTIGGFLI